jgi:hypothetical protein
MSHPVIPARCGPTVRQCEAWLPAGFHLWPLPYEGIAALDGPMRDVASHHNVAAQRLCRTRRSSLSRHPRQRPPGHADGTTREGDPASQSRGAAPWRTCRIAAWIPPVLGSPCPGSTSSAARFWRRARDATAWPPAPAPPHPPCPSTSPPPRGPSHPSRLCSPSVQSNPPGPTRRHGRVPPRLSPTARCMDAGGRPHTMTGEAGGRATRAAAPVSAERERFP